MSEAMSTALITITAFVVVCWIAADLVQLWTEYANRPPSEEELEDHAISCLRALERHWDIVDHGKALKVIREHSGGTESLISKLTRDGLIWWRAGRG